MNIHRAIGCGLAALLIAAAGCDNDAAGPGTETDLTADELQFLAVETDRMLDAILGDEFDAQGAANSAPSSASSPAALVPVTTTFSFERTRPCPVDGEINVAGEGQFIVDHELGTAEMAVAGTKSANLCAFQRQEIVYTIDGDAEWDAAWESANHELLTAERNANGSFSITTSDGRSAQCRFRLHAEYTQGSGRVIVTGVFCERTVDQNWDRG